jgi:hypothetical protein
MMGRYGIIGNSGEGKYLVSINKIFARANGGPRSPSKQAQARPSSWPRIATSRNLQEHMSAGAPSNISPNPSEVISEVSEP